ncbi:MAG: 5-methyltetrahydrofolate--homocysteine methyltransferase [Paludibacter sp.]|nr:5-methyltetrahydrofolate--homocysteine methyltransferase [Paludibacter sp.]
MTTYQLQLSDLEINREDIYLNLGYGGAEPDEHINQLLESVIDKAYQICRPQVAYIVCEGKLLSQSFIELNDVKMKIGSIISGYLEQADQYAVFVATAGEEYDNYLKETKLSGDIVAEFLADAVGSEIAEAAVRYVNEKIEEEGLKKDYVITKPYSPGYCGWNIREQVQLFSLFPTQPCGILLNDSCLMHPVKSVSGMVGMGSKVVETPYGCDTCSMQTCYKRKNLA